MNYIQSVQLVEIVLLQEYKFLEVANGLGKNLWPQVGSWCLDASVEYNNPHDGQGANKGGEATLISIRFLKLVSPPRSIMNNQVLWIILSGLPSGYIGTTHIYTLNEPHL